MANVTHYVSKYLGDYNYTMYVGETLFIKRNVTSYSVGSGWYTKGILRTSDYPSASIPGVKEYWDCGAIYMMNGTPTKAGVYVLYTAAYYWSSGSNPSPLTYKYEELPAGVNTITITVLPVNPVIKVNVGGTWKDSTPKVKVSGEWKDVTKAFMKVNGTWKEHV